MTSQEYVLQVKRLQGVSQRELARQLDINAATMNRLVKGTINMSVRVRQKIHLLYNADPKMLLMIDGENSFKDHRDVINVQDGQP
jgi:transcriptional regulator with XRE-family HTH domain